MKMKQTVDRTDPGFVGTLFTPGRWRLVREGGSTRIQADSSGRRMAMGEEVPCMVAEIEPVGKPRNRLVGPRDEAEQYADASLLSASPSMFFVLRLEEALNAGDQWAIEYVEEYAVENGLNPKYSIGHMRRAAISLAMTGAWS
jgi:hypothetical protein